MPKNKVTMLQAGEALIEAGFTGWRVPTFIAIGWAESGGDTYALNLNVKPDKIDHLSLDIGLWQINDYWWPKYARAVTTDLFASAKAVHSMVGGDVGVIKAATSGKQIGGYWYWNTYKVGAHIPFLHDAVVAAKSLGVV